MKPTQKQITAAENLFLAKANVAAILPIIQGIQASVLSRFDFKFMQEENRTDFVKNISDRYEMDDADFAIYAAECQAEYVEAGFTVEDGSCPLLIAEDLERQAQRAVIDAMEPITGLTAQMAMSNYTKYLKMIDLAIRYLTPFCGNSKQIPSSL